MNFLEERIMKDGIVKPGNVLKVDSFLNHQMDITLIEQIGKAYGVYKIVDLRKCGIWEGNISTYDVDTVHPNAAGMRMIAAYIYNCITDDEQPIKLA